MKPFSASELRIDTPYRIAFRELGFSEFFTGRKSSVKRDACRIANGLLKFGDSVTAACVIDIRTGMVIWYRERL